jgi:hypothetical protein
MIYRPTEILVPVVFAHNLKALLLFHNHPELVGIPMKLKG